MTGTPVEIRPAAGSTWRPFGAALSLLALLALFVVPAALDAPVTVRPLAAPDQAANPGTPDDDGAIPPSSTGLDPQTSSPPPPLGGDSFGLLPSQDPPAIGPQPDDGGDGTSTNPPELPEPDEPESSPLVTLAEAIPAPPNLPIPDYPEELQPLADSVAPAMFLVCSAAALPGGLASIAAGLAGDPIPGMGALIGALLLYQVPILDLCVIFGFPDELVECTLDDQILEQYPQAVPVNPPAPAGSMLGIIRGVEGLSGDTSGSDEFLESLGCEARPS